MTNRPAFSRLSKPLNWNLMASTSTTSKAATGYSFTSQLSYYSNQWYGYYTQTMVSRDYDPQVGFVYNRNIVSIDFGGYRIIRKSWIPKGLMELDPGVFFTAYHRANDGRFLQATCEIFPFYTVFLNGGWSWFYIVPTWQNLPDPISIVGIPIEAGKYFYTRYRFAYATDQSKRLAYSVNFETGNYYDGKLDSWTLASRISPIPHVSISVNYQYNNFRQLGERGISKVTHLVTPEIRLGLNPRIQLITYYQYNSATERAVINTRLAWEYRPLTYIYLVYNENRQQIQDDASQLTDLHRSHSAIIKITFLKQF